jgi:hypothetical protein
MKTRKSNKLKMKAMLTIGASVASSSDTALKTALKTPITKLISSSIIKLKSYL